MAVQVPETNNNEESAVQVYLRLRPLIPEEKGHELIQYETNNARHKLKVKLPSEEQPKVNPVFASAPSLKRRQEAWKLFDGFTNVLEDDYNNEQVYETTLKSLVLQTASLKSQSACIFTYGHTGSGKSHTLLGYGTEQGVYKLAARNLFAQLSDGECLLVRVTELYKDNVVDLLTGEPCSIRQDAKGVVQVRGPMVEDNKGKITQRFLGQLCLNAQQVAECVEAACASRRVGNSTHHSQSSRSHLVLELEVVTPELVEQRKLLLTQESQLTRLMWLQTERMMSRHTDRPLPKWAQEYNSAKLRKYIQQAEKLVIHTKLAVSKLGKHLGGTLVFCDLAGNEYARDAAGSTKEELEEAAEINKSLLAVKEMIRNIKSKSKHVPCRDSKLTMVLRRHLDKKAVMLAHISPSRESLKKTINTLTYSSLVSQTKTQTKTTSPSKKTSPSKTSPSKMKGKEIKRKQ